MLPFIDALRYNTKLRSLEVLNHRKISSEFVCDNEMIQDEVDDMLEYNDTLSRLKIETHLCGYYVDKLAQNKTGLRTAPKKASRQRLGIFEWLICNTTTWSYTNNNNAGRQFTTRSTIINTDNEIVNSKPSNKKPKNTN